MAVSQNGKDWESDIADAGFREAWEKQIGNEIANQCNATTREGKPGAIYAALQASGGSQAVIDGVVKAIGAGGDFGVFEQLVNTTYSGTQVVLYEARLISGPITHPISHVVLPHQTTVFDDLLAAIGGK